MQQHRTIKTLLVDCDGVLNNNAIRQQMQGEAVASVLGLSWKEAVAAFFRANQVMHDTYRSSMSADEYKKKWAGNDVERFRLVCKELGLTPEAVDVPGLAKAWRDAWNAYDEHPVRYDDAKPFLERMQALGLPMVLVSGVTNEDRWGLLRHLGVDAYFTHAFGTQSIGYQKKDIRFYEAVLEMVDATAQSTAIIGDNPIDDVGAGRLGIYTVHLLRPEEWEGRAPDYAHGTPDMVVRDLHAAGEHLTHLVG